MATKPKHGAAKAAAAAAATSELQSSLRELHIGEKGPTPDITRPKLTTSTVTAAGPKKKRAPVVADSWEDEVDDASSETEAELGPTSSNVTDSLSMSPSVTEGPLDPPPTPISPQISQPWVNAAYTNNTGPTSSASRSASSATRDPNRRPEKQTAVAGRLIAGALGIRAPKRTEEQRAYDRAVKEQEIRRRNREREEAAKLKEEEEKAKAAVWDD
ncbi:hypothetical protein BJX61DRAFT_29082 [Aspergillus egyptiacus]|nr:hypothetical protein BJX61DRAFT_29082 [Aspergillus egyptiacus]